MKKNKRKLFFLYWMLKMLAKIGRNRLFVEQIRFMRVRIIRKGVTVSDKDKL